MLCLCGFFNGDFVFLASLSFFETDEEEQAANQEEQGQSADAPVGMAGGVRDKTDDSGAEEGRAFADDVIESEVLAGLLCRDDLCEVGAAHRLDTALEHADADGEDPELGELVELHAVEADEEVRDDADENDVPRLMSSAQAADDDGGRERHELRDEQGREESDRVETEGRAVSGSHVDDGVDAVNVEKERQKEQADFAVRGCVLDRLAEFLERIFLLRFLFGNVVGLLVHLDERQGHEEPPEAGQGKADGHGVLLRKRPDALVGQDVQRETHDERDDRADVAPGIALAGDVVDAVFRRDIVEHGVVDDKAQVEGHTCDDEHDQEDEPLQREAQEERRNGAHRDGDKEQPLLHAFAVRERTIHRAGKGRDDGGHRLGVTPVGKVFVGRQTCVSGDHVEKDRDECGGKQNEGGVGDIVEDPLLLGGRELVLVNFAHGLTLLFIRYLYFNILAVEVPVEAVVPLEFAGEAVEECGDELDTFVYGVVQDAVQDFVGLITARVRLFGHEEVLVLLEAGFLRDGHECFARVASRQCEKGQDELLHAECAVHVHGGRAREELLDVLRHFEGRVDVVRDLMGERVVPVHTQEHAVEFRFDGEVARDALVHHLVDVLMAGPVQGIMQDEAEEEREFLLAGLVGPAAELVVAVVAFQAALRLHSLAEVLVEDRDHILELRVPCRL